MNILVTGDGFFIERHYGLVKAISTYFDGVTVVPSGNLMELFRFRVARKCVASTPLMPGFLRYMDSLNRRPSGFLLRSAQTEKKIKCLERKSDFVLHIFSSFGPFRGRPTLPFAMYLDFTMALAQEQWQSWADFRSDNDFLQWMKLESKCYEQATIIFTMGNNCRDSLIRHYNVPQSKIVVVGSGVDIVTVYKGERDLGSRQIIFYGSEFDRKGGDIAIESIKRVREHFDCRLVVVGSEREFSEPWINSTGFIRDKDRLRALILNSDLCLAPSRCEPFTTFVLETMALGVPAVVSSLSGVSSVITDGVDGFVVNSLDPEDFSSAVSRLLVDSQLLVDMSINCRSLISGKYNWDIIAEKVAATVHSALVVN